MLNLMVILQQLYGSISVFVQTGSYQSVGERCVQSDRAAGGADGEAWSDGGDGAGSSDGRCGGAGGHQRLLTTEQRLTEGGETFLRTHTQTQQVLITGEET